MLTITSAGARSEVDWILQGAERQAHGAKGVRDERRVEGKLANCRQP
jgi:hypothetical protein